MSDLAEETWFLIQVFCAIKTSFLSFAHRSIISAPALFTSPPVGQAKLSSSETRTVGVVAIASLFPVH
jgi:hypothetical protein